MVVGNILSFIFMIVVFGEYVFALSHYIFTTDCNDGCDPIMSFLFFPENFRPTSEIDEYTTLQKSAQEATILYHIVYWFLVSDLLRFFYSWWWVLIMIYIKTPQTRTAAIWIYESVSVILVLVEVIKTVIHSIVYFARSECFIGTCWYVESPAIYQIVFDSSLEFQIVMLSGIVAIVYLIVQMILIGLIAVIENRGMPIESNPNSGYSGRGMLKLNQNHKYYPVATEDDHED
ncbi:MAG: hypothetical protein ACTSUE_13905 [Promethearchaeota archaeon]